jgi:hypothetical protein
VLVRWLSVLTDLRIWAAVAISGILSLLTLTCLGWSFSTTLVQREEDLARMSQDERLEVELRTIDRLGEELVGVDIGGQLDEAIAEQEQAIRDLQANGQLDAEGELALDELHAELRRTREGLKKPAPKKKSGELEQIGPRRAEKANLVPPWAAALGCGLGIFALGGAAAVLTLRTFSSDDEAPDEPG